tara:strand:- start:356 stop:1258 length:903 start_codon:yes stop_codon:yes gene_type:complete
MTIILNENTPRISYTVSNGVTRSEFPSTFEFYDATDLTVFIDGTITTAYSIAGGSGTTGTITLNSAITGDSDGTLVVITRSIPLKRITDFPTAGAFNISQLNTELDRMIAITGDLKDGLGRSLTLQASDTTAGIELPSLADRKGKTLAFNASTGLAIAGPSIADVTNVTALVGTATTASASATVSKNSATASALTATNAATSATNALASANLPTSFSGASGKIIQVNSAENAYEFATSATNNGIFYGLKVNQSTGHLVLDYSVLGQSASFNLSDYDNYFFSSPQVTFALDTSGDLIITTP